MVLDQHRLQHILSLFTNVPWGQTSKLYSGQVSCYMLIKYEEELQFFLNLQYQERFLNTNTQDIIR